MNLAQDVLPEYADKIKNVVLPEDNIVAVDVLVPLAQDKGDTV